MWWILALIACGDPSTPQPTSPVQDEGYTGPRIETQLSQIDPSNRQLLTPVVSPKGRATYQNCNQLNPRDQWVASPPVPSARPGPAAAGASQSRPPTVRTAPSASPPGQAETASADASTKSKPALMPAPPSSDLAMGSGAGEGSTRHGIADSKDHGSDPSVGHAGKRVAESKPQDDSDEEILAEPMFDQRWDYGATLHLSNDDSMSLASAQRVLWSAMNRRRPSPQQIRAHELLNYFSFETVPVPDGQTFSVLGSAEAQGETLSVALAVQGALPPRQPLDLTLAVDRSGSMAAEGRATYTRRGLTLMSEQLQAGDRIDLILFDDGVCTPLQDWVKGRDDDALLHSAIQQIIPRGGTNLELGLRSAYALQKGRMPAEDTDRNHRVLLMTDAHLNMGTVDPNLLSVIGKHLEDSDIRLTGIGVGRDFRDDVLNKLTEKGKGAYVYLGSEAVVDRVFGSGFDSLVQTLAHDVRFSIDLPPSLAMERFYGEEISTEAADIQPIHYYAGTSQVFLQDLHIAPSGLVHTDPLTMRIEWTDAQSDESQSLELQTTVGALVDSDRRNLHKAQALMAFSDVMTSWAVHGPTCEAPLAAYVASAEAVGDDAELDFLNRTLEGICGSDKVRPQYATVKVQLDSDQSLERADLICAGWSFSDPLSPGDTVAKFEGVPQSSSCSMTLHGGPFPLQTQVNVPRADLQIRCTARSGSVHCG